MQIADIFLALFSIYLLFSCYGKIRLRNTFYGFTILFAIICAYQVAVNLYWGGKLKANLMSYSMFYIFNLVACVDVFLIGQEIGLRKLKEALILGVFIALVVSSAGLLGDAVYRSRSVGFFNNPNQLGYFALMAFSYVIFCNKQGTKLLKYAIFAMASWAIIKSSSKAAFVALFFTVFIYMIAVADKSSKSKFALYVVGLALIGIVIYLVLYSNVESIKNEKSVAMLRKRIFNMETENDSDLGTGRGYDRIAELGSDFLWGVGEGKYSRFKTMPGYEVHSTYASLLVSYGFIGIAAYALLTILCILDKKNLFKNIAIMSGPLMYQVTHNGVRNPLVWILLAAMLFEKTMLTIMTERELRYEYRDLGHHLLLN